MFVIAQLILDAIALGNVDIVLDHVRHIAGIVENRKGVDFVVSGDAARVIMQVLHDQRLLAPSDLFDRDGPSASSHGALRRWVRA